MLGANTHQQARVGRGAGSSQREHHTGNLTTTATTTTTTHLPTHPPTHPLPRPSIPYPQSKDMPNPRTRGTGRGSTHQQRSTARPLFVCPCTNTSARRCSWPSRRTPPTPGWLTVSEEPQPSGGPRWRRAPRRHRLFRQLLTLLMPACWRCRPSGRSGA